MSMKDKLDSAHMIVVNVKRKILLVQRNDVPLWVIPGGKIEKGEKPDEAAEREFFEETGFTVKTDKLVARFRGKKGKIKFLFCGKIKSGKFKKNKEIRNWGWFSISSLPIPISLYESKKIEDFFLFNGQILDRKEQVKLLREILHQLQSPLLFVWLIYSFLKNRFFGSKSFRLNTS